MAVVADALVSKIVDVLVSTIAEEIKRVAGVEEEVEKLTLSLQSIQAVLVDAERRQWKEATTVQLWLDRLKSVAYDIDDVLDEWIYEILRSQIEREENADKTASKVWRSSFLSVCYCFPKVVSRHHMADKISKLNARLDLIATEKERYGFQLMGSNIEHIMTVPHIDMSEVKGRDSDKEKLVNMLIDESSEMSKLRLIPLVGMGGIGKTTLARLVYNDARVKSHFYKRSWVCVSDPFDEIRVAREILEFLGVSNSNLVSLPNVMEKIQESLVDAKEYLFVLDDVWNEDPRKWEQLGSCLKGSSSRSRILVTTRNEKVGRIMGCLKSDIIRVGLLSEEESWELFSMIAFFGRSSEDRMSLEKIGREVVGRCKGLPLAIKAIASLLQLKEDRREWQSVLDSEVWNHEEFQRDIAPALWLSYYDLPSNLKQCFSYCAIFPKDYEMEKDELIRHWVAQGYIKTHSQDIWKVGEEYFQNLVMRSFFQDVEVYDIVTTCKMHDIVHDFAQLLVRKESHNIEVDGDSEEISFDNDSFAYLLRHLSISFEDKVKCLDAFYDLRKLHSLIVSGPKRLLYPSIFFGINLQKLFNVLTHLRSLKLRNCGIEEVPSNINRLIHLKELDLFLNTKLKELPDTVWEMYNLQILDLDLTKISSVKRIGRLTNLSYLGVGAECSLPKEVARFSGLSRLNRVNIDVNNEDALSLKHLKDVNQLVGEFEIRWLKRGDGDLEDAKQVQLMNKKHIIRLEIHFGDEEEEKRKKQDEELVEALKPPPNLESLCIEKYMGSKNPNWLHSLTAVKMVRLVEWRNVEHLPPLGKLPCLENLELWDFYTVAKVGGEFLGMDEMIKSTTVSFFPKLKSLAFNSFVSWEEWNDVDEEMLIMPSLTSLYIYYCQKLKALPTFILKRTPLKLEIKSCDALQHHSVNGSDSGVHV